MTVTRIPNRLRLPAGATTYSGHTSRKVKNLRIELPSRITPERYAELQRLFKIAEDAEHPDYDDAQAVVWSAREQTEAPWPVRYTELFDEVARRIELFEESYDQGSYGSARDCGSVGCLAGHGGMATGWNPVAVYTNFIDHDWDSFDERKQRPTKRHLKINALDWASLWRDDDSEVNVPTFTIAREEFGLTNVEGAALFDAIWHPAEGLSVPDALRRLGQGARLTEVSIKGTNVRWPGLDAEYARRGEIEITGVRS